MPNKLTDNEIKKALECCIKAKTNADCEKLKCPFWSEKIGMCRYVNCEQTLYVNALDLINRYETKIDELQELVNEMSDYFPACIGCEGKTENGVRTDKCVYQIDNTNYCVKRGIANIVAIKKENKEQKAEIEKLNKELKNLRTENENLTSDLSSAKAEAYKEFAERLKEKVWDADTRIGYVQVVDVGSIEDLLKEMGVDGKEGET